MARIAIIGAGNLGAYLAAHLSVARHEVFFCARRPVPPIRIAGLSDILIRFYLQSPPPADLVLLTTKAHQTPAAMAWLPYLCAAGAPVAVIQNGVHQAARVAPYAAIPVLAYVYVEAQQDAYHAFAPPLDHFTVPADPLSEPFANLFTGTGIRVRCEPEFQTASWRKMLHNCVSNPLTALAGRGLEILKETVYHDWAERILDEALPIAQADGAALSVAEPDRILQILASYPPGTRTSMLQDREQGKTLELNALNGALIELGRYYKLPTPVNEDLVARLYTE